MNIKKTLLGISAILAVPCFLAAAETAIKHSYTVMLNVDGDKLASDASLDFPSKMNPLGDENIMQTLLPDQEKIKEHLLSPKDAPRAVKFLSMMKTPSLKFEYSAQTDNSTWVVLFNSPDSKLRPDMNYIVFKSENGKWLWDLSAKSHLITMLSESVRFSKSYKSENEKIGLNAKFIDLRNGQNFENPVFKFYQTAQKEFYDMRLEEYPKFMTQKSAEVFTKQFLSMSKEEQQKILEEYITWHKVFYGIFDMGKVKVIAFKRVKQCAEYEMYDCAYIIESDNGFKLANFGQNQGAFADYAVELSKADGF